MLLAFVVILTILLFLPVVGFLFYPSNKSESEEVRRRATARTYSELHMFKISDVGLVDVFYSILKKENEKYENVLQIKDSKNKLILFLKYLIFRRSRPLVSEYLKVPSVTTATPSFPAGHSFQAFLLAKHFSKKYPHLKTALYSLAESIGQSRIAAGWHYPSDHSASKWVIEKFT